jgi:Zn-dependent metalloprotease
MKTNCRCLNCILPPHILKKLLEHRDKEVRQAALNTLLSTAHLRGQRSVRALTFAAPPGTGRRTIYDLRNNTALGAAVLARTESGPASTDGSVNRAFDGFGATRDFYKSELGRNSLDDKGMQLNGFVHRAVHYNNAFWDGQEMIFGDGDGVIFTDFTGSLDVIAHELTHGVTEFTANLEYHNQSGALNESMSDVFGSVVKQWYRQETAAEADWLIGAEIFTPAIEADALRSMKAPGTAYDNDDMGKDPQPDHMDRLVILPDTEDDDWGGVHINSGIPNKAFYLAATGIGGNSWKAPAHIWYESLLASNATTEFQEFADTTVTKAGQLYGSRSAEQQAVADAWRAVGLRADRALSSGGRVEGATVTGDAQVALTKQIAALAAQVEALREEFKGVKAAQKMGFQSPFAEPRVAVKLPGDEAIAGKSRRPRRSHT